MDLQAEAMEADYDLGVAFRDDLIPKALAYYLGIIEDPLADDDEWGSVDDADEAKEQDCQQ